MGFPHIQHMTGIRFNISEKPPKWRYRDMASWILLSWGKWNGFVNNMESTVRDSNNAWHQWHEMGSVYWYPMTLYVIGIAYLQLFLIFFSRSRSFFFGWVVAGMTPRGFQSPAQIHWLMTSYSPLKHLAVLGGFATQKTIRHPPRIQQEKSVCLTCFILFHLVSSENMLQKSSSLMS